MKTSDDGLKRLVEREGMRRNAYRDVAGIWTICCGHTGPEVKPGMSKTLDECRDILRRDVAKFERCVEEQVDVPLDQHQFDALVSLVFNIGCGAFRKSTVLRELNRGHYNHAADAFRMWKKAGGKTVQGLVNRRESERNQFNGKFLA